MAENTNKPLRPNMVACIRAGAKASLSRGKKGRKKKVPSAIQRTLMELSWRNKHLGEAYYPVQVQ